MKRFLLLTATMFSLLAPVSGPVFAEEEVVRYKAYEDVLKTYVGQDGLVNYSALKKNRKQLDQFVTHLGRIPAKSFRKLNKQEKLAFWINAYNALTLQGVIDHYPLDSFRDVGGWFSTPQKKLEFRVMGKTMNLDHIEHEILRKAFNEPRLHMAINCAAFDCPRLLNEVYRASNLEKQLAEQSKDFINHPKKFHIDTVGQTVYLSKIFDWFGEDFVETYTPLNRFKAYGKEERAILNFASKYGRQPHFNLLDKIEFDIKYRDYNWALNEQK